MSSEDSSSASNTIWFFTVWAALFGATFLAITVVFPLSVAIAMVVSFVGDALLSALAMGLFS
jgi:hypothetical protein